MGRAVVNQARQENLNHEEEHAKVDYVVAHGISSAWRERQVVLGSRHFVVQDEGVRLSEAEEDAAEKEATKGRSILYMAVGGRLAALIAIKDQLRPQVRETLENLKDSGLGRAVMLTGDIESTAAIALSAGFRPDFVQFLLFPAFQFQVQAASVPLHHRGMLEFFVFLFPFHLVGLIQCQALPVDFFQNCPAPQKFFLKSGIEVVPLRAKVERGGRICFQGFGVPQLLRTRRPIRAEPLFQAGLTEVPVNLARLDPALAVAAILNIVSAMYLANSR